MTAGWDRLGTGDGDEGNGYGDENIGFGRLVRSLGGIAAAVTLALLPAAAGAQAQ